MPEKSQIFRKLRYKGFYETVNRKPKGKWLQIFASDWFKRYWTFYAYISLKNYEKDIEAINELIYGLNWRDDHVYVELIDHSAGHKDFHHHCMIEAILPSKIKKGKFWSKVREEI
jgi:hypothetical protein